MFSQQLKRLAGPALTLGGLPWISVYVFASTRVRFFQRWNWRSLAFIIVD